MSLKLMYITNNLQVASIAQAAGVDRIWVDLERLGKAERQANMDTVQSMHTIEDIKKLRPVITTSQLMVRIDPLHSGSAKQIDDVIQCGADIIMLPMFKSCEDVHTFLSLVNGRAKTILLLETIEAENNIDEIVNIVGIDEIHIGLNDLHLAHKMKFMFELVADGTVERLCKSIENANIPFGFGGIAKIGTGTLPAEVILAEHYRLHSSMVILSRAFCPQSSWKKEYAEIYEEIFTNVEKIRRYENDLKDKDISYFNKNKEHLIDIVNEIIV